jgi:hypothetical protein
MPKKAKATKPAAKPKKKNPDYFYEMSHAPEVDDRWHIARMLPIIVFCAVTVLIVRMHPYTRPMDQFFWTNQSDTTSIKDFFSYYKMVCIVLCSSVAMLVLLYQAVTQSLAVKRSFAYIFIPVYAFFVVLSYMMSDYKEFAWLGWNDRFEGTLTLLCYMAMLFYIINTVRTEKDIKAILYPFAVSVVLLSLLGISQGVGADFFQTTLGQKLIMPNGTLQSGLTIWESIDAAAAEGKKYLTFHFQNKEIYQTIYNINYVSFYLTLLIPLVGMLFIAAFNKGKDEKFIRKIALGVLFSLIIYNLIGSDSSGGFFGLGIIGLSGILLFNKKLLRWVKPLLILFVITGVIAGVTAERWMPELGKSIAGVLGTQSRQEDADPPVAADAAPGSLKPMIDYIVTKEQSIELSINNNPLTINALHGKAGEIPVISVADGQGNAIPLQQIEGKPGVFSLEDERFSAYLTLSYLRTEKDYYLIMSTQQTQWKFFVGEDEIYYYSNAGRPVSLYDVPHFGFEDNPNFGSWRGYIWSRSFPLLKDTFFAGTGADTYPAVFPQEDFAGKYSTSTRDRRDIIVDKPHNMYLHMAIGTGWVSLFAMLGLFGVYIVQSIRLFRKSAYESDYIPYLGAGIFLGVLGFLAAAMVNDSTVSVMPMFYTLLGLGISINMMLKPRQ